MAPGKITQILLFMNSSWHYSVSIGYRIKSFLKAAFYIILLNAVSKIFSGEVLYAGNFFMLLLMGFVLVIKWAYQVELKNDCIKTRYGVITSQLFNLTRVVKFSESPTSITFFYADGARFTIWIKRLPAFATEIIKEQLNLRYIPFEQSPPIEPSSQIAQCLNTDQAPITPENVVISKPVQQTSNKIGRKLQNASILFGLLLMVISVLALVTNTVYLPIEQGFINRAANENLFYMVWAACSILGSLSACFGFYLIIKNSDSD